MSKRQFKDTSKQPTHQDRKVIHTKTGRLLSLTKIIPRDWAYVRIYPFINSSTEITIRIVKLAEVNNVDKDVQRQDL